MKHLRLFSASACVALLALCVWWLVHPAPWQGGSAWYVLMASAWLLFAFAFWLIRKVPRRAAAMLIVVGGVVLPLGPDSPHPAQATTSTATCGTAVFRPPASTPTVMPQPRPSLPICVTTSCGRNAPRGAWRLATA
jgi:di/tricarboxylate transporter